MAEVKEYCIGANRSPGPVFFRGLRCRGLYLRGASIRDRALLIHRFSTAFTAPIMVSVSKNTSVRLQLYQEKSSVTYVMCKSSNCIGKVPISGEIPQHPGPSTHSTYTQYILTVHTVYLDSLVSPGHYSRGDSIFLITVNGWPSIQEGLLFRRGFYSRGRVFERVRYLSLTVFVNHESAVHMEHLCSH